MKLHISTRIRTEQIEHQQQERGYTVIQLLMVVAIVAVVTTFAIMGIASARAHVRLQNSVHQFAGYVERVRSDSLRRHATPAAIVQMLTNTTYSVTMDFGASGTVTTQTFSLEEGTTFTTPMQTITFDWRGRTPNEVSVGFLNNNKTANVNITGSGDVTIDSEIFQDTSVPNANINSNPGGGLNPDPAGTASPYPTPTPSPTPTPTPYPNPTPTPTPNPNPTPTPTPNPTPTPTPVPTATPTPTPIPTATPTPSPTPVTIPCSINATPSPLNVISNGSGTISVNLSNFSGTTSITATSGSNGQIQVSPSSKSVTGSGSATFTITVKKQSDSVTFSSSCGSKTVTVNVQ